jgi:hypothetical protein
MEYSRYIHDSLFFFKCPNFFWRDVGVWRRDIVRFLHVIDIFLFVTHGIYRSHSIVVQLDLDASSRSSAYVRLSANACRFHGHHIHRTKTFANCHRRRSCSGMIGLGNATFPSCRGYTGCRTRRGVGDVTRDSKKKPMVASL